MCNLITEHGIYLISEPLFYVFYVAIIFITFAALIVWSVYSDGYAIYTGSHNFNHFIILSVAWPFIGLWIGAIYVFHSVGSVANKIGFRMRELRRK